MSTYDAASSPSVNVKTNAMATSAHSLVSVVLLVTDDANDPDNVLTDDSVEVLTLVRVCDMLDELEVTETAVDGDMVLWDNVVDVKLVVCD